MVEFGSKVEVSLVGHAIGAMLLVFFRMIEQMGETNWIEKDDA
jgi:hypothetical protein